MATDRQRLLEAEVAAWVTDVTGVAFLSPHLLRRLTTRTGAAGGVRVRPGSPATIEIWIAVRSGHQAAATARAVRRRVAAGLADRPGWQDARVQVVVSTLA
ncbi:hypothetical protein AB0I39_06590 [Kitasatospora purpeofusca]|uniref:hypothetical protein n=1 Tax=Kitasatospora purpeofusca TaxID=67352 RepID=UPI00340DD683